MIFENIQLAIDLGLVVLIWMTQLITYPGFLHYPAYSLEKWHANYTSRITLIVFPLMVGQLAIAAFKLYNDLGATEMINAALVTSTWLLTFLVFVPMHDQISKGLGNEKLLENLVKKNWMRTAIWTLIFLLNLLESFNR